MTRRYVLTLDLRDDPALIAEYEAHHRAVPAGVEAAIRASGIVAMEIYRLDRRLVMIVEVEDGFSFARKAALDAADPDVVRWEALMARFQQVAPDDMQAKWRAISPLYRLG